MENIDMTTGADIVALDARRKSQRRPAVHGSRPSTPQTASSPERAEPVTSAASNRALETTATRIPVTTISKTSAHQGHGTSRTKLYSKDRGPSTASNRARGQEERIGEAEEAT